MWRCLGFSGYGGASASAYYSPGVGGFCVCADVLGIHYGQCLLLTWCGWGGERVPGKPEDCPDRFDTLGRESNTNENTCKSTNKMLTKYNYKIYRPNRFNMLRRGSKIVYSYSTI